MALPATLRHSRVARDLIVIGHSGCASVCLAMTFESTDEPAGATYIVESMASS
jgi:hypothetical protein